jgi:hypothetical protein
MTILDVGAIFQLNYYEHPEGEKAYVSNNKFYNNEKIAGLILTTIHSYSLTPIRREDDDFYITVNDNEFMDLTNSGIILDFNSAPCNILVKSNIFQRINGYQSMYKLLISIIKHKT